MPQHGFARTSNWALITSEVNDEVGMVTLGLESNEKTRELWPHEFELRYIVKLWKTGLSCSLRVFTVYFLSSRF